MQEEAEKIEHMLEKMYVWAGFEIPEDLRVCHIEDLFGAMNKALRPNHFPEHERNAVLATNRLNSGEFDLSFGTVQVFFKRIVAA